MANQGQKEKILRFVLESSPEENQKLAYFMAGIRASNQNFCQGKAEEGKVMSTSDTVEDVRE
jgi:hypothetical protein